MEEISSTSLLHSLFIASSSLFHLLQKLNRPLADLAIKNNYVHHPSGKLLIKGELESLRKNL